MWIRIEDVLLNTDNVIFRMCQFEDNYGKTVPGKWTIRAYPTTDEAGWWTVFVGSREATRQKLQTLHRRLGAEWI